MEQKDLLNFRNALGRIAVATRSELDKPTIRVYEENLKDLPIAPILRVLRKLEATSEFFPKLPVIRAGVLDEMERGTGKYLPADQRPEPCATCEGTKWVEAAAELPPEGQKPIRRVRPCPDCNVRKANV